MDVGMSGDGLRRLKEFEKENERLRRAVNGLERAQPEGSELCTGARRRPRNGVAQGDRYPAGCGVQNQPELVGVAPYANVA